MSDELRSSDPMRAWNWSHKVARPDEDLLDKIEIDAGLLAPTVIALSLEASGTQHRAWARRFISPGYGEPAETGDAPGSSEGAPQAHPGQERLPLTRRGVPATPSLRIAAARLRVKTDARRGVKTEQWIVDMANSEP